MIYLQIIAVCDFLNYLRYVERGLVKSSGTYKVIIHFSFTNFEIILITIRNVLIFYFYSP